MRLSTIKNWLNKSTSTAELKEELNPYLNEFKNKIKTKGTSVPMFLTEDINISFGFLEFYRFCDFFLKGELTEFEISYIAEVLLLAPSVIIEDEKIIEGLEFLCDFDIYGKFSKNDVENLIKLDM